MKQNEIRLIKKKKENVMQNNIEHFHKKNDKTHLIFVYIINRTDFKIDVI